MSKISFITALLSFICFTGYSQDFISSLKVSGSGLDDIFASHIATDGSILVAGHFSDAITFAGETLNNQGGFVDAFLAKMDADGNELWIKSFGGQSDNAAFDVSTDSEGNIVLIGYFQGAGVNSFDADPGPNEFLLAQVSPLLSRDCFIIKLTSGGDFIWAKQISNPGGGFINEDARTLNIDENDNIFLAGNFLWADFDPGPGDQTILSSDDGGSSDGFLLKLNSAGEFQWVKTFDGDGYATIESMDMDASGNIYLGGRFDEFVDMDPSSGEDIITALGSFDVFFVKLDPNGNYLLGNHIGGTGLDVINQVNEINGDIFISGGYENTIDLDQGPGTSEITSNGGVDAFMAKYNSNGEFQFSYTLGNASASDIEEFDDVDITPLGTLALSGTFLGTVDFNQGPGEANGSSNGSLDFFIMEVSLSGEYIGHITMGGLGSEKRANKHIDSNGVMTFVGGRFQQSFDSNPYAGEALLTSTGASDGVVSIFEYSTVQGCPADFNNDQIVDVNDFLIFNSAYAQPCDNCIEDLNGDNMVDIEDFLMFNSAYGICP
jgi:hypothetical protein